MHRDQEVDGSEARRHHVDGTEWNILMPIYSNDNTAAFYYSVPTKCWSIRPYVSYYRVHFSVNGVGILCSSRANSILHPTLLSFTYK